jgi:hypothetical protein
MTMQHTPGPWSIEHDWFGLVHVLDNEERIIATLEKHDNDHAKRQRANAALIRAAPEMLAALRALAGLFGDDDPADPSPDVEQAEALRMARAAIVRAEGR